MDFKHEFLDRAEHLIEALPYIRRFYGKTIVVKCGGAAMVHAADMQSIIQDIALLYFCGMRPVLVHGGGPDISEMCDRLGIPVRFENGLRVTDAETLEVVQMVLMGKTNRMLISLLNRLGVNAVGLSGHDSAFIKAKPMFENPSMGFVGRMEAVDTTLIQVLLDKGFVPVIAPIGVDENGQAYNINADIASGAIAGHLGSEKLIMLSDVNGIYKDPGDASTQMSLVDIESAAKLVKNKQITGGMIPKLQACIDAIYSGVHSAHIIGGKMPHSLLLEMLTDKGVGTMLVRDQHQLRENSYVA